jgi:hypothetical protein
VKCRYTEIRCTASGSYYIQINSTYNLDIGMSTPCTLFTLTQGVSKRALQWYSKCYCVASVTKTFTLEGVQKLSTVQGASKKSKVCDCKEGCLLCNLPFQGTDFQSFVLVSSLSRLFFGFKILPEHRENGITRLEHTRQMHSSASLFLCLL